MARDDPALARELLRLLEDPAQPGFVRDAAAVAAAYDGVPGGDEALRALASDSLRDLEGVTGAARTLRIRALRMRSGDSAVDVVREEVIASCPEAQVGSIRGMTMTDSLLRGLLTGEDTGGGGDLLALVDMVTCPESTREALTTSTILECLSRLELQARSATDTGLRVRLLGLAGELLHPGALLDDTTLSPPLGDQVARLNSLLAAGVVSAIPRQRLLPALPGREVDIGNEEEESMPSRGNAPPSIDREVHSGSVSAEARLEGGRVVVRIRNGGESGLWINTTAWGFGRIVPPGEEEDGRFREAWGVVFGPLLDPEAARLFVSPTGLLRLAPREEVALSLEVGGGPPAVRIVVAFRDWFAREIPDGDRALRSLFVSVPPPGEEHDPAR